MSNPLRSYLWVVALLGVAFLIPTSSAKAEVVSANTVTLKRFTGLLSGSGPVSQSPGQALSPKAHWVDFICDPKDKYWKIGLLQQFNFPWLSTLYIDGPRICDHVEIIMFYYNPQQSFPATGPVDGLAISIRKIP